MEQTEEQDAVVCDTGSGRSGVYDLFKTPAKFQPKIKEKERKKTPKRKLGAEDNEIGSPQDKVRPRTPSGQILSVSVGQLRSKIERGQLASVHKLTANKGERGQNQPTEKLMCTLFEHVDSNVNNSDRELQHNLTSALSDNWCEAANKLHQITLARLPQTTKALFGEAFSPAEYREESKDMTGQKEADQGGINQNPSVGIAEKLAKMVQDKETKPSVSVEEVVQLLQELKVDVTEAVKKDINVSKESESIKARCVELEAKMMLEESKQKLMVQTIVGLSNKVQELQAKCEQYDINSAKRMVVVSGLEVSQKKKICRMQLERFFENELGVQVEIDEFYWIGSASPQDIVVSFTSSYHRHQIYQNIGQIQSYRNSKGKKYVIRDFNTPRQVEFNKKCQDKANQMVEVDPVNRKEISVQGNKLYVGDEAYVQKVNTPDAARILQLPLPRLNMVMAAHVNRGPTYEAKGNKFTGYVISANNTDQVQEAYMKIKVNHADARHVVCGYSLPGTALDKIQLEDGCDDDDHGASRAILEVLKASEITHRAVFVVRECGDKLHGERLEMYRQITQSTLAAFPMNEVLQRTQHVNTESPDPNNSSPREFVRRGRSKPSGAGRGGGGRGRGGAPRGRGGNAWSRGAPSTRRGTRQGETGQTVTYIPKSEADLEAEVNPRNRQTPWDKPNEQRAHDSMDEGVD